MLPFNRPSEVCSLLPFLLVVLFLLISPVLLTPSLYGLLAVCLGLSGFVLYLLNVPVNRSVLAVGTLVMLVSLVCAAFSGYFWNGFEFTLVIGVATVAGATVKGGDEGTWRGALVLGLSLLGLWLLLELALEYYHQVKLFGWYGFARLPVLEFRNPNVLARVFGLLGLGLLVIPSRLRFKILAVPLLLLVVLSGSRGALLALALAGLVYFWREFEVKLTSRRGLLVVLFALLLVVVIGVSFYPSPVAKVTTLQRMNLLQESVHLLSEHPITGVGAWNFGLVYPEFSFDDQWQRHPHSLPFWILTAFGYGGTLLIFVLGAVFLYGTLRAKYLPLVVFLLVHELVDTMVWIPGVFVLGTVLVVTGVRGAWERARSSRLFPLVCLMIVLAGLLVWKTDADFKRGLEHYRGGEYDTALAYWWNDWSGFTEAHRSAAYARRGDHRKALKALESAIRVNGYDPYYLWLKARLYRRMGRAERSRAHFTRYRERDPHGMLTLEDRNGEFVKGRSDTTRAKPSFTRLWWNQRKPRYYLSFVEDAVEGREWGLARSRINFLLGLPKLTREARDRLLEYRTKVVNQNKKITDEPEGETSPPGAERLMFRSQFHYFFYRRPGSDYVPYRPND